MRAEQSEQRRKTILHYSPPCREIAGAHRELTGLQCGYHTRYAQPMLQYSSSGFKIDEADRNLAKQL